VLGYGEQDAVARWEEFRTRTVIERRADPALRALLISARAGVVAHRGSRYALTWVE
jgi:hypothetical protein